MEMVGLAAVADAIFETASRVSGMLQYCAVHEMFCEGAVKVLRGIDALPRRILQYMTRDVRFSI